MGYLINSGPNGYYDIKNTDQLIPILDVKFDKYGVMYGWAGNQAVLTCDPKKLGSDEYQEFLKDIENLDIPEAIKKANRIEEADETEEIKEEEETEEDSLSNRRILFLSGKAIRPCRRRNTQFAAPSSRCMIYHLVKDFMVD